MNIDDFRNLVLRFCNMFGLGVIHYGVKRAGLVLFRRQFRKAVGNRKVPPLKQHNVQPSTSRATPVTLRDFPWKRLVKQIAFGAGVGTACFSAAAILRSNDSRRGYFELLQRLGPPGYDDPKRTDLRQRLNLYWNNLTPGSRAVWLIIGINAAVYALWRVPALKSTLTKYFMLSTTSTPYSSMLLSTFSHVGIIHLSLNMYVLHSLAPLSADGFLGIHYFLALYISSGLCGSLVSSAYKLSFRILAPTIGASGAILGVLGYTCAKLPESRLHIVFLPQFDFSGAQALLGLLAFDTLGVLLRWRMFDHAAHLGGVLFGAFYALYGERYWMEHLQPGIVSGWRKLRGHD